MNWKLIVESQQVDLDSLILNIVDDDLVEEGVGKMIAFGVLAFLLGSSDVVEAAQFRRGMRQLVQDKQVQNGRVTITKKELKKVVDQAKKKPEMVGKWELGKAKNVLARTLYMEARGDGVSGLNLVMTVIWNRAGGLKEQLASVCLRPSQFSCWENISGKTPSTYQIQFPKCVERGKGEDFKMWNECVRLADSAFNGTYSPIDSHWNAYYNPDKCSPRWATQLLGAKTVGHHVVGELKDQTRRAERDKRKQLRANQLAQQQGKVQHPATKRAAVKTPAKVAASPKKTTTRNYVVKSGDSLWSISGKSMKKIRKIKELNGLKSDVIKPGQTLKIPA